MKVRIHLTGTTKLLLHNSTMVNPLDEMTQTVRAVTSKLRKTDDDHAEIARLEHKAGLYYIPEVGPYLPGWNIFKSLVEGARLTKAGKKVERGLMVTEDINPLVYDGPRDAEGLWAKKFFLNVPVRVGAARLVRCRPQFPAGWQCETEGLLDTKVLSLPELQSIAEYAGTMVGIGDWRPRFGKFEAVVQEI
jgi:hypothetical protein